MTYNFCEVCKRNNNEGKRHLYTKKHQERLSKVLERQQESYRKFKIFLKDVHPLQDTNKQPDFTCFFCGNQEVKPPMPTFDQNGEEKQITFACNHIFQHLSTKQHHTNVTEWFSKYHADRKLINEFIVKRDDIEKFKRKAATIQKEVVQAERASVRDEKRVQIDTGGIKMRTSIGTFTSSPYQISMTGPFGNGYNNSMNSNGNITEVRDGELNKGGTSINYMTNNSWTSPPLQINKITAPLVNVPKNSSDVNNKKDSYTVSINESYDSGDDGFEHKDKKRKITNEIFAQNLTRISVPPLRPGEGNVFTEGSVPPWLRDDNNDTTTSSSDRKMPEIGPSLDAFLKAKKMEKSKKLNPNRVGAKFNREGTVDKDWVPNFGRVWNNGTRSQSHKQFKREMNKRKK